jgi:hemerythrin-like domain-containing protein
MQSAISIIRDEHRSIAAVLHGLQYVVAEIKAGRMPPDFALLGAMLHYIEAFPEKLHHPKEDDFLYRALRERDPGAAAILDRLGAEHVSGARLIVELQAALARFQEAGPAGIAAFAQAVQEFANFHWAHMRAEEDTVLPLAEKVLTADDWRSIDAAFQANVDPIRGVDTRREFRELFRRIANLAPPPIGLGPSQSEREH